MKLDPPNLPEDSTFSNDDVTSIVIGYQEKIHYLEERIRLLQNELFGRKSEKRYPDDHRQLPIFEQPAADTEKSDTPKTIVVAEHQRIRGRKPLPDDLPRIEVIHDIPEDQTNRAFSNLAAGPTSGESSSTWSKSGKSSAVIATIPRAWPIKP